MKAKTQGFINHASSALQQIQSICIGVFYNYMSKDIHLVLEDNIESLIVVRVGTLLGLQTDYNIPRNRGMCVMFPGGKTMTEMMEDPIEFQEWYKENITF